ncbi:hypothetical protein LR48_Vigan774s000100 [Vigna angularis]|uniref:DUF8039 domain-containing protein n=1 Tax=Phaseolus angularis TaxID=3914 RepID=A0A0L9TGU6_PHAAN|nr:hypothetical protein LR48_Vigan774s000100 [Vigna angularis]
MQGMFIQGGLQPQKHHEDPEFEGNYKTQGDNYVEHHKLPQILPPLKMLQVLTKNELGRVSPTMYRTGPRSKHAETLVAHQKRSSQSRGRSSRTFRGDARLEKTRTLVQKTGERTFVQSGSTSGRSSRKAEEDVRPARQDARPAKRELDVRPASRSGHARPEGEKKTFGQRVHAHPGEVDARPEEFAQWTLSQAEVDARPEEDAQWTLVQTGSACPLSFQESFTPGREKWGARAYGMCLQPSLVQEHVVPPTGRSRKGSCSTPTVLGDDMDDISPCLLYVLDGTKTMVVACGIMFQAATIVLGMELSKDEVKFLIDNIIIPNVLIPLPTYEIFTMAQTFQYFTLDLNT